MAEAKLEPEDRYVELGHPETAKPPQETHPTSKASRAFSYLTRGWPNTSYEKAAEASVKPAVGTHFVHTLSRGTFSEELSLNPPLRAWP